MAKTLLLLDLDGVVIPMRHTMVSPASDEVAFAVTIPPRTPTSVPVRPAVITAITRWVAFGYDVQWLSSWGWRTKWLDQMGLPPIPVLYDPDPGEVFMWGRSGLSWKRPAVAAFLENQTEPVRLAWVDDDAFYPRYEGELLAAYPHLSELLLVQPDCFVGLTDTDLRRIEDFLDPGN